MLQILICPLVAALIAQLGKLLVKSNNLKLNWQSIYSYSGMPSSHAAMVISLAASVGLVEGFRSPLFFVCVILCFFIIRDALGLRNYLGQHGKILNNLVKDLNANIDVKVYPRLAENIGHTPAQIIAGAVLGFLVSLAGYYIF